MIINSEVSELCGVILGDRHLHNRENRITITGSLQDLDYYTNYIVPLFVKNFNISPRLVKVKNKKSYRLIVDNKKVFSFFVNDIGLKRGKKSLISIPDLIIEDYALLCSFIRGLFDTDGYLKFSKQSKAFNYYPRIRFTFYKTPLSLKLSEVFQKLGFNFGYFLDKRYNLICYEISGHKNLEKWMDIIGSSNPVHLTKYLFWTKFRYCVPDSTIEERQSSLQKVFK